MPRPSAFGPESSGQPDPQRQLQLVVHAGPLAGKGFPIIGPTLTFGREPDNDITLDDSQVSRHHARLTVLDDEIILEDLGSTNGTLVNGKPIVGEHVLQPADIISIGSSIFGVKGFRAPHTLGVTQVSMEKPTYPDVSPAPPRPAPPAPPAPGWEPAPRPAARPAKSASSGLSIFAIGGILALLAVIVIIAGISAYFLTQRRSVATSDVPEVVITAPLNGSQVPVNLPLTVQATASDPIGVVRMELWVSGLKTAESISPATQGQPTLTASFQWTPEVSGSYTLEVRAFNGRGAVSTPTVVTINAVGDEPTPTNTPTASETPTATVPSNPALVTKTDLNVRAGPGIQYDLLGLLPTGTTAEIIGRSEDRQWWQIRFVPAADGVGWVAADPTFSDASNVDSVPVISAPPTPTPSPTTTSTSTPTATFAPPTGTPTATDTPTPTDTPTSTAEPTNIQFTVSPTSIEGGKCVNVSWNVTGVREIYYEGEGVGGTGNLVECPKETKTYRLRVIKQDGSEQTEERTVEVINPIVSSGTIKVDPNQTVDFDRGEVSGNDFSWSINGDVRHFERQSGVRLAPMRDISSLDNLTLAECADADFNDYDFIDASDDAPDEINKLIPGRSACYRTNEGRLGKLRFPEASTGSLRIEWLTWK